MVVIWESISLSFIFLVLILFNIILLKHVQSIYNNSFTLINLINLMLI